LILKNRQVECLLEKVRESENEKTLKVVLQNDNVNCEFSKPQFPNFLIPTRQIFEENKGSAPICPSNPTILERNFIGGFNPMHAYPTPANPFGWNSGFATPPFFMPYPVYNPSQQIEQYSNNNGQFNKSQNQYNKQ
jgi:hypothetical protein